MNGDLRAACCELQGDASADAAGASGDQSFLSLECHTHLLVRLQGRMLALQLGMVNAFEMELRATGVT
jgi:hypothetical protein